MSTLEILRATRASIVDPEHQWDFGWWPSCTCGHIYRATTGHEAEDSEGVIDRENVDDRVRDAYREIARVLGLEPIEGFKSCDVYGRAISDATFTRADTAIEDEVKREHALSLIDDAITALEAEQERNRLDVLAQARNIIDNAPVPVA